MRVLTVTLLALALFGGVRCQYDDEEGYGGGEGGGEGGYGGEDEDPPPPPPEDDESGGGGGQELTSLDEYEAFLDNDDASVIGAFTAKMMADPTGVKPDEWDDEEDGEWTAEEIMNPALKKFTSAASSMYNFRFAWTTASDVLEKLKVKSNGIFLYRSPKFVSTEHGDRPRERFPSDTFAEATLSSWVKAKAQPLVGKWSYATKERYEQAKAVLVVFLNLDFDKNAKGVAYALKRARKAAVELKAKGVAVAVASSSELSYELQDFGLESKRAASDLLMGIKAGDDHYGSTEAFSGPALLKFAESFLKGELTAHVKPPPPPMDDDDAGGGDDDAGDGDDDEPYGDEDKEENGDEDKEEM